MRCLLSSRVPRLLSIVAMAVLVSSCAAENIDVKSQVQFVDVVTGWFDAGIVEGGKNKLVPTISLRVKNNASQRLSSVQFNAVFRRVQEQEEWGTAYTRGIGTDGVEAGGTSEPIVLRSELGYTSEVPRSEMFSHRLFVDAKVEVFAKHGSDQWIKLAEFPIERKLLTKAG